MSEDLYRQIQKQLDTYSLGFPETKSGIEIQILKFLFTDEEAEMFSVMSPLLETPAQVAERLGKPLEQIARKLEDMSAKGLLFKLDRAGVVKYGAIPFVHGLFEFKVKNLDPRFAKLTAQYFAEGFEKNMRDNAAYFLRTIPVGKALKPTHNVASYEDAVQIIKAQENIVVTECICRKSKAALGQSCAKPLEACFMFGSMAQYYLDHDMGRKIGADEAIKIVEKCQEEGLVTQPATAQNPGGMCNCCGDCCGVLTALNNHPKPATLVFTNHLAIVDPHECNACEICLDRCQMKAIRINDKNAAEIDQDRCIGCGLCVTTCQTEAITLVPRQGEKRVPPGNSMEQMIAMARKRGVI